uniref:Uncharacterized protein n=1 Tax=Pithovirus LCDPAC02 TaxID=2506601 RepID=A0A481YPH3_9VIRU|nr:MAG: hypothetical protein LCDPAC02_03500 [Pithovirus LCDPAC02]
MLSNVISNILISVLECYVAKFEVKSNVFKDLINYFENSDMFGFKFCRESFDTLEKNENGEFLTDIRFNKCIDIICEYKENWNEEFTELVTEIFPYNEVKNLIDQDYYEVFGENNGRFINNDSFDSCKGIDNIINCIFKWNYPNFEHILNCYLTKKNF